MTNKLNSMCSFGGASLQRKNKKTKSPQWMDHQSDAGVKSLQLYFHTVLRLMETHSCLGGREFIKMMMVCFEKECPVI